MDGSAANPAILYTATLRSLRWVEEAQVAYAAIAGWGMYVPERVLSNADLERMVDTSDEWIRTRTGIRERRVAGPGEFSSTMGATAARQALEEAGVSADSVDLIVVGTSSP